MKSYSWLLGLALMFFSIGCGGTTPEEIPPEEDAAATITEEEAASEKELGNAVRE